MGLDVLAGRIGAGGTGDSSAAVDRRSAFAGRDRILYRDGIAMLLIHSMRLRRRVRRGFTLAEVAVSMLMVVVGILPVITLMLLARHVDNQARIQAAAYNIARQEIDTLKAQSWSNRVAVSQSSFAIPTSITNEFPNQSMQGDYNITTVSNTFPATQQISVRVR